MMGWLYAGINITAMVLCLAAGVVIGAYAIIIRQKWRRIKVGFQMFKQIMPWIKAGGLITVVLTIVGLYQIGLLT
jgi:ABC-type sugar transport system substrate-binding protein